MKCIDYLDELKREFKLTSDYQIAKKLGIRPNRISNYRTGVSLFDDDTCIQVANLLDLNPAEVLANIAAERSKSPEARKAWQKAAKILHNVAACFLLVFILNTTNTTPAFSNISEWWNIYYVKSEMQQIYPSIYSLSVIFSLFIAFYIFSVKKHTFKITKIIFMGCQK